MKTLQYPQMLFVYRQPTVYSRLGEFSFYLLLSYILFGTSTPFPERDGFNPENATSIYNQIFFSLSLVCSFISLIPLRMEVVEIFRREKLLLILLGWCTLSLMWSVYPFIGVKRIVLLVAGTSSSLAILLHSRGSSHMFTRIKYILMTYLLITLVSVLVIPGAIDPKFGTWRGLEPTKNNLGQVAIVCLIMLFIIRQTEPEHKRKHTLIFLVIAALILLGSWSVTSIGVLVGLLMVGLLVWVIDVAFNSEPTARVLSTVFLFGFTILFAGTMLLAPDLLTSIPNSIGKDITFSGRTFLWESMWVEIQGHWWFGTGYAGFWNPESVGMEILHEEFVWLPNQAHNGYLDVLNELGLIGLIIFSALIVRYIFIASRIGEGFYWHWFIAAMLVMNLQESTFLRPHNFFNAVFLFAYVLLFVQLYFSDIRRFGADEKITSPN